MQALEPHISEEIMKLHHQKHHQTYVNGLNSAEESYAKSDSTKEKIALQAALKFNGGGEWQLYLLSCDDLMNVSKVISTTPCSGRTSHQLVLKAANSRVVP